MPLQLQRNASAADENVKDKAVHVKMHSKDIQEKMKTLVSREFHADGVEDQAFASSFQKASYMLLHAHLFEHTVSAVIMSNLVLIVYETDLNASGATTPMWVTVCYWSMLALFLLESALRLLVLRSKFWLSPMNVCDLFVVCMDVGLSARSALDTDSGGVVSISAVRFLRLLRLLRATKALAVFPELRLMMGGLSGACSSIFWGTVLLFFALIIWGVLAVQFIHPLNLQVAESGAYDGCDRCSRAYETTWQAALTFTTQIVCGDSWARETVPIIEMFPVTAVFFMGVFLSVGMALLNLILGVVVNAATEARDSFAQEIVEKKAMKTFQAKDRLLEICAKMDADGSGELSSAEIQEGFDSNEEFKETISDLGIHDKHDLEVCVALVDTGKTGSVSFTDMVSQMYTMRSSEMDYLLAYVKLYVGQMKDDISENMRKAELKRDINIAELLAGSIVAETTSGGGSVADNKSNIAGTDLAVKESSYDEKNDVFVMTSVPKKDSKKADIGEGQIEEKKLQGDALGAEMASMSSEALLSQLQVLRQQLLTSTENMRCSHVEMLEATIQSMTAFISSPGAPSADAAARLYQKDGSPRSKTVQFAQRPQGPPATVLL